MSQCIFKENSDELIIAIHPPSTGNGKSGLSRGALIAIIVASIVFAMILGTCGYIFFLVRKKRKLRGADTVGDGNPTEQKHASDVSELVAGEPRHKYASNTSELVSEELRHELGNLETSAELVSEEMRHELVVQENPVELEGSPIHHQVRNSSSQPNNSLRPS